MKNGQNKISLPKNLSPDAECSSCKAEDPFSSRGPSARHSERLTPVILSGSEESGNLVAISAMIHFCAMLFNKQGVMRYPF